MISEINNINKYSDSFLLKRVTIYKCASYRGKNPTTIRFNSLSAIIGETGAGKTTIIDAITFPIWKTTPRLKGITLKIEDFCDVDGFCEVEFEKNKNLYVIRRGRKSNGESFVLLTINGEKYPDTKPTVVDKIIKKIIGIDYESFANTSYIPQDEIKEIINKTPSERLELFNKILKLDIFDTALEITKKRKEKVESEIKLLQGQKQGLSSSLSMYQNIDDDIKKLKNELFNYDEQLKNLNSEAINIENECNKILKEVNEYLKLDGEIKQLLYQYQEQKKTNDALKNKIQDIKEKLKNIKTTTYINLKYGQELLDDIKKHAQSEKIIFNYTSQCNEIKKRYEERRKQLNLDIKKYDVDGLQLLEQYRIDYSIQKEYVYDVIKNETKKNIYTEIDSDYQNQIQPLLEWIESEKKIQQELKEKIGNETEKTIQNKIKSEMEKQKIITQLETEQKTLEETINENKCNTLLNNIKEKEERIKELKKYYIQYNEINSSLSKINTKMNDIKSYKNKILGELGVFEKNKKQKQEIEQKLRTISENLTKNNTEQTILESIKNNIFHKQGMASYTLQTILQDLEHKASEIVSVLTYHRDPPLTEDGKPNRMQKISFTFSDKKGGGIDIKVDGVNAHQFSGGEKTIISLAIRLAFSQKLLELTTLESGVKILIIDEGDLGSLDNNTLSAFTSLLKTYTNIFDTIILITHIKDAIEGYSDIIKIEKDTNTGYSTVIF